MQRADHHDAEAVDLANRVDAGRREITELRARAAIQAANIEEIEAAWPRSTRPRTGASANTRSRRGCRTSGARCWRRRGASWRRRRRRSRPRGASIARREAERAGATQRRDELSLRGGDRRRRGDRGGRAAGGARRRGAPHARRDRRPRRPGSARRAERGDRGRGAPDGRARRDLARRDGAGDAARGGAPPALAPGVADRDPGSLRALSEGRSRDHAGAPRGGWRRRDQGGGRRHRAAAPGAGDRRRGGAGRTTGQRHRRLARGRRRGDPVPQAHARGPIVVHSARPARARASAARPGRLRRDRRAGVRDDRRRRRSSPPSTATRSPRPGRRATACAGRCSS